ncbi:MAG: hypothetical protein ACHQ49_06535 [Elusimicrobiota bacterium]
MKNLALVAGLVALSSAAFGYQERIERNGDRVVASWISPAGAAVSGREPAEKGPIAGNFYSFTGTFPTKDMSCDQFLANIHGLISDWNRYPHMNFYALSTCSGSTGGPSSTDFIYAVDAWRPEAVAEVQAFLNAHRDLEFQGQKLWFSQVKHLDVKTTLSLDVVKSNGGLRLILSSDARSEYSGTDQWYPANYAKAKTVVQTDLDAFLDWVGRDFGADQKTPFKEGLATANFVQFSDFFTLHLENGRKVDFWLGFGASRKCGAKPCFAKAPLSED